MRRADRKMAEIDARELLKGGEYGVLCLVEPSGGAYGVPLNYAVLEDNVYVHAATEGKKLDCVQQNNKVCFLVVGETQVLPDKFSTRYESVMAFGEACLVTDDAEKERALLALLEKYSAAYMEKGIAYLQSDKHKTAVIRIAVESITGKKRA